MQRKHPDRQDDDLCETVGHVKAQKVSDGPKRIEHFCAVCGVSLDG